MIQQEKRETAVGFSPIKTERFPYEGGNGWEVDFRVSKIYIDVPLFEGPVKGAIYVEFWAIVFNPRGVEEKRTKKSYKIVSKGEIWEYPEDLDTGVIDYDNGTKITDADTQLFVWDSLMRPYFEPAIVDQILTREGLNT